MVSLFDHLKNLYDEQLYSNVVAVVPMIITINENNYIDPVTLQETFQIYYFFADSLYHLQHYRKAETIYKKALQFRKSILKPRGSVKPHDSSLPTEAEIKYKMHLCYVHTNQVQESIDILQSIPAKQRSAKINLGLGKAYDRGGLTKQAIAAYKEVLKSCPFALETAERLLALKVSASTVLDIIPSVISDVPGWNGVGGIVSWIAAVAQIHSGHWVAAAQALKALDTPGTLLRGCPNVLINLGEVNYYSGEYKQAIAAFQRAHSIDPLMLRGLDIYAGCLSRENRLRDRADVIIPPSLPPTEYTPHHWLALAYLHVDRRRLPLAAYLAQKACIAEPSNPEALLLKGKILLSLKKYSEALEHFREAKDIAPDRYEPYAGLAEANVAIRRIEHAKLIAMECCKEFNHSPRALTMYADILLKEGEAGARSRARNLLKNTISVDNVYLPASLALARLIDIEDDSQADIINLLEEQVSNFPSAPLHQALADLWAKKGENGVENAVRHYGAALALDPGSRRALDALARLDRTPTTPQGQPSNSVPANPEPGSEDADNTYELLAEANVPSDISVAPEESETEAVWSDMDLEVP